MSDPSSEELLYVGGIDGESGEYAVPGLPMRVVEQLARGEPIDLEEAQRLRLITTQREADTLGWPDDIEVQDVRQAGWALVIHQDEDPEVRKALEKLYEHRRAQIGNDDLVKILMVRPGETSYVDWLNRHGVGAGSPDPRLIPCYLLLAGAPTDARIPFSFGQGLSVEYCPGRLFFATAAEYARYVESLIAYESGSPIVTSPEVAYFAPRQQLDKATPKSVNRLVRPLAGLAPEPDGDPLPQVKLPAVAERRGFSSKPYLINEATKARLGRLLAPEGGGKTPSVLFSAGHGMIYRTGHERQPADQGALLCQDWSGLGNIDPSMYFSAADLPTNARIHGMVAFLFACFGGGTPATDRFLRVGNVPRDLAPAPFLAALPRALLAHEGGGAIGCIAHVDRAWAMAFSRDRIVTQIKPFEKAIDRILRGWPLGYALRDFGDRYARLSTDLSSTLFRNEDRGATPLSDAERAALVWTWVERNDAEGYVLIGDPAASLRADDILAA